MRDQKDRRIFLEGLDVVVKRLKPIAIVIYGSAPKKYFEKYREAGIKIVAIESEFAISHREVE